MLLKEKSIYTLASRAQFELIINGGDSGIFLLKAFISWAVQSGPLSFRVTGKTL